MMAFQKKTEGWPSLVYGGGLENRCAFTGTGGSNPLPSAIQLVNEKI